MSGHRAATRPDGLATKEKILESAGQLFGAQGFGVTTSKAVAEQAGVDLASINYHFGSRDGLYEAVLIEAHRRFVTLEELTDIAGLDVPPDDKLRRLFNLLAERFTRENHWSGSVLVRELLNQSPHIAVLVEQEAPPKIFVVLGILSEITGIEVGDPSLSRCLVSVLSPCLLMYLANNGRRPTHIQAMQATEMADHLYRFAMAGLHAISIWHEQQTP